MPLLKEGVTWSSTSGLVRFRSRRYKVRLILLAPDKSSAQVKWKATPTLLPVGPSGVSTTVVHMEIDADNQATRPRAAIAMSTGASNRRSESLFPPLSTRTLKPPSSTCPKSCRPIHPPGPPIRPTSRSVSPSPELIPRRLAIPHLPRQTGKLQSVLARPSGLVSPRH